MPRYTLSFRIDPLPSAGLADATPNPDVSAENALDAQQKEHEFRKAFYHSQGLKLYSYAWAEIPLDSPKLPGLLAALEDLQARGIAILGSGHLTEHPTEQEPAQSEWFIVTDDTSADPNRDVAGGNGYPTSHAYRFPTGTHVPEFGMLVSERFKAAVEESQLTGLEFLWVNDIGRHRAVQWHVTIPRACMGHGVDHPWYDRAHASVLVERALAEREATGVWKPVEPVRPEGTWHFYTPALRAGWSVGDPVADRLLSVFPQNEPFALTVHALRRFLREGVPQTDFAYHWTEYGWRSGPDGEMRILPNLCLSRHAKDELVRRCLLREKQVECVVLLDRPNGSDTDYLDHQGACPLPVYGGPERDQLRTEETRLRRVFGACERPIRKPDLKRSLSLLRQAKKTGPEDFARPVRKASLEKLRSELPLPLPQSWVKVLSVSNGGVFGTEDNDCEIIPLEELPRYHQELYAIGKEAFEDYPEHYLNVGTTAGGDYFALELEGEGEHTDCPVVLFSHETCHIEQRWDSIPAFLKAVLTEAE